MTIIYRILTALVLCIILAGTAFISFELGYKNGEKEGDAIYALLASEGLLESLKQLKAGNTNAPIAYHMNELWENFLTLHESREDLRLFYEIYSGGSIDDFMLDIALQFDDHPIMAIPFEGLGPSMVEMAAERSVATNLVSDEYEKRLIYGSLNGQMERAKLTQEAMLLYLEHSE